MTATGITIRRPDRRQQRALRRAVHLITGLAVLVELYAAPFLGAGFTVTVQWVLVPVLIASGVVMWQGPRLRRVARGWRSRRV